MNVALWILQVLLALHTVMGAVWKFTNSTAVVPSLSAIPHQAWLLLSVVEILCAIGLIVPLMKRSWAKAAPAGAALLAAEMLMFCGVHLGSGAPFNGEVIYWLVVAVIGAFIAYGRFALKPLLPR
jgi:hypothetical protein